MTSLDGKALSVELIDSVKEKAKKLKPTLAVILVGQNPASLTYVKHKQKACEKAGVEYMEFKFPDGWIPWRTDGFRY